MLPPSPQSCYRNEQGSSRISWHCAVTWDRMGTWSEIPRESCYIKEDLVLFDEITGCDHILDKNLLVVMRGINIWKTIIFS